MLKEIELPFRGRPFGGMRQLEERSALIEPLSSQWQQSSTHLSLSGRLWLCSLPGWSDSPLTQPAGVESESDSFLSRPRSPAPTLEAPRVVPAVQCLPFPPPPSSGLQLQD